MGYRFDTPSLPYPRRSQGNQDLILYELFRRLGTTNKYYVEFGFDTDTYFGNHNWGGSNTHSLNILGWTGLLLDGGHDNPAINLHKHFLFHANIAELFKKYNVPTEPDYISNDMDSHDWFVMLGILEAGYRPRVVTLELNTNYYAPDHAPGIGIAAAELDPNWPSKTLPSSHAPFVYKRCVWGTSPKANQLLMKKYNYTLVAATFSLDMFYVRNDWLPPNMRIPTEVEILNPVLPLHHPGLTPHDPPYLRGIVDVEVLLNGGTIDAAKASFQRQVKQLYRKHPCFSGGMGSI